MKSLLYDENPLLAYGLTVAPIVTLKYGYRVLTALIVIILLVLLYFYRYEEYGLRHPNGTIICPADGKITELRTIGDDIYISIFLSPFNRHTQIYPTNGTVTNQVYDRTGKFDLVVDGEKSRDNEKVIHTMVMPNGGYMRLTQIAGFLPRCIEYVPAVSKTVFAGEYLGIIKFGSRVDLQFPRGGFKLSPNIVNGARITFGDLIGTYQKNN